MEYINHKKTHIKAFEKKLFEYHRLLKFGIGNFIRFNGCLKLVNNALYTPIITLANMFPYITLFS